MGKFWIAIVVFLIFGALIIKQDASDATSFTSRFISWIGDLFGNVKDITGHAVSDYKWLPDQNQSINGRPLSD